MKRLFILSAVLTGCMAVFFIAFFIGLDNNEQKPVPNIETRISAAREETSETPQEILNTELSEPPGITETKITANTKIIFEYFNELDGTIETSESDPDEFIIGLNEEQARNFYDGYELIAFTEENLILRKYVEKPVEDEFTLGTRNGYVTVYYGDTMEEEAVKEITDTPAAALPKQDQENLAEGISIKGKEQLIKILEDYGS